MARIKIKYQINDISNNIMGIKNKNIITFKDNDILVNISYTKDNIIINRKNNEYELNLNFKNQIYMINLLKENKKLEQKFKIKKLEIEDNSLYSKYELNDELFEFKLKYEVVE